jgi:hypothetical protein
MTGIFKPSLEILPPTQQRLWLGLKAATALGFVLYGGTAIALRLGHRPSVDFNFFLKKRSIVMRSILLFRLWPRLWWYRMNETP